MFCSNSAKNWIIYQSELVIFVINSYSTLGGIFLDTDIWDGLKENKMLRTRVMLGNINWVNISESMLVKYPCGTVEILSMYDFHYTLS